MSSGGGGSLWHGTEGVNCVLWMDSGVLHSVYEDAMSGIPSIRCGRAGGCGLWRSL